jgi:hypothetical protein
MSEVFSRRIIGLALAAAVLMLPLACKKDDLSERAGQPPGAAPSSPPVAGWIELVGVSFGAPPQDRLVVTTEGGARVDITTGGWRQPRKVVKTVLSPCDGRRVAWLLKVISATADQPLPVPKVIKGQSSLITLRWQSGQEVCTVLMDERALAIGVWSGIFDELDFVGNAQLALALAKQSEAERLAEGKNAKQACEKYEEALKNLWHWDGERFSRASVGGIFEPQLQLGEPLIEFNKENYGEALRLFRDLWKRNSETSVRREEDGVTILGPLYGNMGDDPPSRTLESREIERLKGWRFSEKAAGLEFPRP